MVLFLFLLYIADIGHKANSQAFIYVYDSKVLSKIKDETSVIEFQTDMKEYYNWARNNNMSFKESKFDVLMYGRNQDLKD